MTRDTSELRRRLEHTEDLAIETIDSCLRSRPVEGVEVSMIGEASKLLHVIWQQMAALEGPSDFIKTATDALTRLIAASKSLGDI